MIPVSPLLARLVYCAHRATWLLCALLALAASHVDAQTQEARIDQILHADRDRTSSFAGKTFSPHAADGGKQAQVKPFAFGGQSSVLRGDGQFRAKGFANPKADGFHTENYLAKASTVSQHNSFAQSDKAFGTKSMDVRESPAANKSAAVRDYTPANQTFYGRGKRQDMLDDRTQGAKDLTIEQVRDLLNKGPAAKPGTILEPMVPSVR